MPSRPASLTHPTAQGTETVPGAGPLEPGAGLPATALRGTNQSGMRAYNERLVLTLVRQLGALAKSDIARMTGLSAQTVSVIMRKLETEGLLQRGEPVRGRVGQPSVPMSLAPGGAFFFGLKIGRRSLDLILADFLGNVVDLRRQTYRYPQPDQAVAFVRAALPAILEGRSPAERARIAGLGIAMPFQLWNWAQHVGARPEDMAGWRHLDLQAELAAITDLPVWIQNDATAACGAELVFGTTQGAEQPPGQRPRDFLYFYLGSFIGGGVVINGQLFTGRHGNAGAFGSMLVPAPGGGFRQLIETASMATLERRLEEAGHPAEPLWQSPDHWNRDLHLPEAVLGPWIDEAAEGLAHAILAGTTVIDVETALIDGWLTPEIRSRLTEATRRAYHRLDLSGVEMTDIREGSVGPQARSLGAAAIPLSQRYLIDQGLAHREG